MRDRPESTAISNQGESGENITMTSNCDMVSTSKQSAVQSTLASREGTRANNQDDEMSLNSCN